MPASSCPNCSHRSFELTYLTSADSETTISAVQCESCGVVVGVLGDNGPILSSIEEKLKALEEKVDA